MEITSLPTTRTVTLITVGFIDGSEYSLTLEAADSITPTERGYHIVVAAKPERKHTFRDRKGEEQTMTISATPERHIFWNNRNIKFVERNQAEVAAYASRVHPDDRRDAGADGPGLQGPVGGVSAAAGASAAGGVGADGAVEHSATMGHPARGN